MVRASSQKKAAQFSLRAALSNLGMLRLRISFATFRFELPKYCETGTPHIQGKEHSFADVEKDRLAEADWFVYAWSLL